jgi:DNA-directed RNA polymerase specialized sigma24 family protein
MGLWTIQVDTPAAQERERRERFASYFPRAFAFAMSLVGDEAAAKHAVTAAFTAVFEAAPRLREDEFRLALFGLVRDMCVRTAAARRDDDALTLRERDVLGLLFDAQLTGAETALLLGVEERAVAADLVSGLRKLSRRNAGGAVGRLAWQ